MSKAHFNNYFENMIEHLTQILIIKTILVKKANDSSY